MCWQCEFDASPEGKRQSAAQSDRYKRRAGDDWECLVCWCLVRNCAEHRKVCG